MMVVINISEDITLALMFLFMFSLYPSRVASDYPLVKVKAKISLVLVQVLSRYVFGLYKDSL